MARRRRLTFIIVTVCMAVVLLCAAGYAYVSDFYRADAVAVMALEDSGSVNVYEADGAAVFMPERVEAGFIFYPGGKVEHTAYAPLMCALAQNGILCVVPEMPLHLAVLDADAADGVRERFSGVENWYIGGHSLGGAMAASYAGEHAGEYEGLVLLAAYATRDLSGSGLKAVSIYGSEDEVLDLEKYTKYRSNLPVDMVEVVLEGGNHAQFGSYGHQEGDGTAVISREEQLAQTVEAVLAIFSCV